MPDLSTTCLSASSSLATQGHLHCVLPLVESSIFLWSKNKACCLPVPMEGLLLPSEHILLPGASIPIRGPRLHCGDQATWAAGHGLGAAVGSGWQMPTPGLVNLKQSLRGILGP